MRNEEIYKLIETQGESTKQILDARLRGFKAEIKSGVDIQTIKLDQIIGHQKSQNNKIEKLENETRVFRLIHRNPTLSFTFIGLSVLGVIALFVLKNYIL